MKNLMSLTIDRMPVITLIPGMFVLLVFCLAPWASSQEISGQDKDGKSESATASDASIDKPGDQAASGPEGTAKTSAGKAAEKDEAPAVPEIAWEYRPYEVLVWVVHDRRAWIESCEQEVLSDISRRCKLADPSGWRVRVELAPRPWNGRLMQGRNLDHWTEQLVTDAQGTRDVTLDKIMIVTLRANEGLIDSSVRELDIKTRTWGARVDEKSPAESLSSAIYNSMNIAFMPVTRIENVQGATVFVRVRAIGVNWLPELDESTGEWKMVPNESAPAWVGNHEILLPVQLRKGRSGSVNTIAPVDFTFLSIVDHSVREAENKEASDKQVVATDGAGKAAPETGFSNDDRTQPQLECWTNAMQRHPLGGRTSARLERFALCVRAPKRPTVLTLVSNDKQPIPLRDLEVYSRLPNQPGTMESEYVGKTDWRGQIVATPNDAGFRVLMIKSGQRPLARVPVVPGLHETLQVPMPNDEQRLYAEGIVKSFHNEIGDLVAQKLILEERILSNLQKADLPKVEEDLSTLMRLEDNVRFNSRVDVEYKSVLQGDPQQRKYIEGMFVELKDASNKFINKATVDMLSRMTRSLQKGEPVDFVAFNELRDKVKKGEESESDLPAEGEEAKKTEDTNAMPSSAAPPPDPDAG
jgi:hypothetical protein